MAQSTGKSVVADALTTAFQQTTASPDGTYTFTESAAPSRVYRGDAWVPLGPTLLRNSEGTFPWKLAASVRAQNAGAGLAAGQHDQSG